jgi:hypothetical protein
MVERERAHSDAALFDEPSPGDFPFQLCGLIHFTTSSEKGRANWQFALIPSCGLSGRPGKLPVCPTLPPRFSFFQGAATGMEAPAENHPQSQTKGHEDEINP